MCSRVAGHFIGIGLELGGKDPAYIRADADILFSVETTMDAAVRHLYRHDYAYV